MQFDSRAVRVLEGGRFPQQLEGEHMGGDTMSALEEKLQSYEDELTRLRVENEQLRQSSQAFGELAERLSVALRTATRVNRRQATAADSNGPAAFSGGILDRGAYPAAFLCRASFADSASLSPAIGASEKRTLSARRSMTSASNIFC